MNCLCSVALTLSATSSLAAQQVQATLIAVEPIVAEWTNAPPGTPGTLVSVPAGIVTAASVVAPVGADWARFSCSLTADGEAWELDAESVLWPPPGNTVRTHADLLLVLWLPQMRPVTVTMQARHLGDTPDAAGFTIDLDNDGYVEVDTSLNHATNVRYETVIAGLPTRLIRVRSDNQPGQPPQSYDLHLRIEPWNPLGHDAGQACPTVGFAPQMFGPELGTNYQLELLDSDRPGEVAALVAHGVGAFDMFFVALTGDTLPLLLPSPFDGACEVLAGGLFFGPGEVCATSPSGNTPTAWRLGVPPLPPGLQVYVQHASATAVDPFGWGATNIVRVDT